MFKKHPDQNLYGTQPSFEYDRYTDSSLDDCLVIITTRRSRDIMLNCLQVASYWQARWQTSTADYLTPTQLAQAKIWVAELENDVIMACETAGLLEQLTRIADAQEYIAENTPQLKTIQDIIDDLDSYGGTKLQQLKTLLQIIDAIVGIGTKLNPAELMSDWAFRGQVLAQMYAQTAAQTAIARGSVPLGLLDGAISAAEAAENGGQIILEGIQDVTSLFQLLIALWGLLPQSEAPTEFEQGVLDGMDAQTQAQSVGFANLVSALSSFSPDFANLVSNSDSLQSLDAIAQMFPSVGSDISGAVEGLCECGAIGGSCSCGGLSPGTPVFDGPELPVEDCGEPVPGFDTYEDWFAYESLFVCWFEQVSNDYIARVAQTGRLMLDFEQAANRDLEYSVQLLYQRVAQVMPQIIPLQVFWQMTQDQKQGWTQGFTAYAGDWLTAIVDGGGEADLGSLMDDYWLNPFAAVLSEMALVADEDLQAIINTGGSTLTKEGMHDRVGGATQEASVTYPTIEQLIDVIVLPFNMNVANMRFNEVPFVSSTVCTRTFDDPCQPPEE